jgi:hypothetical protein
MRSRLLKCIDPREADALIEKAEFASRGGSGWAELARADGKIEQNKWGGTCK